ncbi:MAG TPA: DUF2071 domain-containing protein, partial [Verrucomicrobiae bacterium]|nr:DUF2071 domain-containing protein [Verrucomicrobiae bacterium]
GGIIRRRILVNYRVQRDAIQPFLPPKFRPKLHEGSAIAGICLIRLEQLRPKGIPNFLGMSSENAAHRIAVLWDDENGKPQEGVYIPRRDTDSRFNVTVGGRFFPGEHYAAKFKVKDDGDRIDFEMISDDGAVVVRVRGKNAAELGPESKFKDTAEASAFFESGSLGYSATRKGNRLEGLRLRTVQWKIAPLQVEHVHSSFFDDNKKFPAGSVSFDCALVMRDIEHEWQSEADLYV